MNDATSTVALESEPTEPTGPWDDPREPDEYEVQPEPVEEPVDELVGDGTGEALPPALEIPEGAPECYGKPLEDEGWDQSECEECEVLNLCREYAKLSEAAPEIQEALFEPPRRPDYRVIDNNTGELLQLSLLGAEWEQYKVETLRLSLSGGDEFIKELFDQLVDGELSPGAIVEVVARGIVKEHAPIYKKDGHEGKTVVLLEVVRRITVLGHMTAKVEAAQNVDGEAKVLEEPEPEIQTCANCKHEPTEGGEEPCVTCAKNLDEGGEDRWEPRDDAEIDPEVALQDADDLRDLATDTGYAPADVEAAADGE